MSEPLLVVTGSSRGIGRAIAERAAEHGFRIALTSRSESEIEHVAQAIRTMGGSAIAIPCDISSSASVEDFARRLHDAAGPVSILVNNAGIAPAAKLENTSDNMWQETLATNLSGAFYMSRAFVDDMRSQRGAQILNIASTAGYQGFNFNAAYTASKHGLLGLTRALAVELERSNIAVNALCPGFVRTEILREAIAKVQERSGKSQEEAEKVFAELNDEKRLIEPEEVAELALTLIKSPTFRTGQILKMDGSAIDAR